MSRQRLRKRPHLRFLRWKYMRYVILLVITIVISFISFSITFYSNSVYLSEFMSYMFLSGSDQLEIKSGRSNTVENYRPRDFSGKQQSVNYDYYIIYNDFNYRKPETLTYKNRTYFNNIEILFRFPQKTSMSSLLLIFHSCGHSAYDWFHTAERQRIIGAAIDLGYGCLAFQSTDKDSQCWSNDVDIYENKDVQMVIKGLEGFYKEYPGLASLPRFTFGSSSGGIFSSIFAINHHYQIQGQILYISIILPEILHTYVKARNYPPTAWIHMLRDVEFATEQRINVSKHIFTEHQIPHNAFPIEPIWLKPLTFYDRIPSVSIEASRYMYNRLQKNRWLNYHNFLMYNPRRKLSWQTFLFSSSNSSFKYEDIFNNLNENKKIISEFLNTIYGEHEISYERSFEALKWLKELHISSKNQTHANK